MSNVRRASCLALLVVLLAAPAAAQESDGNWRTAAWYLPNRVLDLLDIFKLNLSGGLGGGVDLRITRLFEAGFSDYNVVRVGLNGRRIPVYREKLDESSITLFGITSGMRTRDPWEVGGTLHFVVLGAEAAFNVKSALDFVGGFFLLDLEDDDLGKDTRSR
jgi:hypothetical protein